MATAFFFNHSVTHRPALPSALEAGVGHVNPSLGVVAELVRRGETIVYYAHEQQRARVLPTGAIFRAYGPSAPAPEHIGGALQMAIYKLQDGLALLPGVLEAVRRERPAYLIADAMCALGWLAARVEGLPLVTSCSTFAFTPGVLRALRWPDQLAPPPGPGAEHVGAYAALAARVRARYSVAMPEEWPQAVNLFGDLTLVYTSAALQPAAEALDGTFRLVGPSLRPAAAPAPDFPREVLERENLVYVSLGSVFNNNARFYKTCLEAFGGGPDHVLFSVGPRVDLGALGPAPGNAVFCRSVPQLEVLARARLLVTHAGANSVNEALYYDVPMVAVPQILEQEVNARRVVGEGVGLALDRGTLTAEGLRRAADAVLTEPGFRRNAARVGATLRGAGGAARAAGEVLAWRAAAAGAAPAGARPG